MSINLQDINKKEMIVSKHSKELFNMKHEYLISKGWSIDKLDTPHVLTFEYSKHDYLAICEDHAMEQEEEFHLINQ